MGQTVDWRSIQNALSKWISDDAIWEQSAEGQLLAKALFASARDVDRGFDSLLELAKLLWKSGRAGGAARLLEEYREQSGATGYLFFEAKAWMAAKGYEKAVACLRTLRTCVYSEEGAEVYLQALRKAGRGEESLGIADEEIARHGRNPWTVHARGLSLLKVGQTREAVDHFREAGELSGWAGSSLLGYAFSLSYLGGGAIREFQELYAWVRRKPAEVGFAPVVSSPLPRLERGRKRIRVAYVSGDFARNPLARFFLPLVREHRTDCFEVIGYSLRESPDAVTLEISQHCDEWYPVHDWTVDALCQHVRTQKVDVMVDLGGWSSGGHPRLFQNRCAPLQLSMLGMMQDTGLLEMDYRLSDLWLDPDDGVYCRGVEVENLLRHPMGAVAYEPLKDAGSVEREGLACVTFGIVAQLEKVSRRVAAVWAEVLRRVDGSRLIILGDTGHRLPHWLAEDGVEASRIEVRGRQSGEAYFGALREMDAVLDSFPFTGLTVTLDAAWMGVPTVTLRGRLAVERGGFMVASRLGMPDLVADTPFEFVEIAVRLAVEVETHRVRRRLLRERVRSAFCDARAWTRVFEGELISLLERRSGVRLEMDLSCESEPRARLWESALLRAGLSDVDAIKTSVALEAAGLSEQAGRLIETFWQRSGSVPLTIRWCEWRLKRGGVDDVLFDRLKRIEGMGSRAAFLKAKASNRRFGAVAAVRVVSGCGHALESFDTSEVLEVAGWAWSVSEVELFSECLLIAVRRGPSMETLRWVVGFANRYGWSVGGVGDRLKQVSEWLGLEVATVVTSMSDLDQNILQARKAAKNGSLSEAARLIGEVLESNPAHEGAKIALAEITGENGRKDLEVDILVEVLQADESSFPAASALVSALLREGRSEDAREVAQGFAEANPDCVEASDLVASTNKA